MGSLSSFPVRKVLAHVLRRTVPECFVVLELILILHIPKLPNRPPISVVVVFKHEGVSLFVLLDDGRTTCWRKSAARLARSLTAWVLRAV